MIAETISLGILSLPSTLSTLGLLPGLFLLLTLGALATYTGLLIGAFKLRHPHIHSMADAGTVLFGRAFGELLGAGQLLFFVFIMASHLLTFGIMLNAVTGHAACTLLFTLGGVVLSFLLTIPRTLKCLSWWSVSSFVSIVTAVVVTMVGVVVQRHSMAVDTMVAVHLWPRADIAFHDAFLAVANIVFAYAGHVAFFTFISELRRPEEFPKALVLLQGCDIAMYVVMAVVVYCFAGEAVRSPALDSAGPLLRKVAYGVAVPTIVVAGVVNGHVAVKYLYVRLFRDGGKDGGEGKGKDSLMYQKTFKARGIWVAINAVLWVVAWIIAEGVPVFNDLLGLTSALFASWFTFGLSGLFWFKMNEGRWFDGWRKVVGSLVAGLCVLIGLLVVSFCSSFSFFLFPLLPFSSSPSPSFLPLSPLLVDYPPSPSGLVTCPSLAVAYAPDGGGTP
jgi:amino acid permease